MLQHTQGTGGTKKAVLSSFALCALMLTGCAGTGTGRLQPPQIVFNNLDSGVYQQFQARVKPYSNISESLYRLGRYQQRSGKHVQAVESFRKVLELQPDDSKALNALGASYDALGKCSEAQKYYSKALQYKPDVAYIYNNLGYSYLLCGNIDLAVSHLKRAAELDTSSRRIANNLYMAELKTYGLAQTPASQPASPPVHIPYGIEPTNRQAAQVAHMPTEAASQTHITIQPPVVVEISTTVKKPVPAAAETALMTKDLPREPEKKQPGLPEISMKGSIEIANGNGIRGMAQKSALFLRELGLPVNRITNAAHFNHASSTIYYQHGYAEYAYFLADLLPGKQLVKPQPGIAAGTSTVQVVLGKDMQPDALDHAAAKVADNHLAAQ